MAVTFAIDVSHHQPLSLNLAQTRSDGCELCIIKAGEGSTYTDPLFASNLAEARGAGQLVAAYWYQRSSATAAAHVARIQQVVPKDVAIIPDVEANSGGIGLTRELVDRLRAAGYKVPWVYIPRWYWQQIGSPNLAGLPPLWSSRYPDNVVGTLPAEWAAVPASYWNGYGNLDVGLLQFTSSARIAGYAPLDASAFRGSRAQLAAILGGQTEEDDLDANQAAQLAKIYDYLVNPALRTFATNADTGVRGDAMLPLADYIRYCDMNLAAIVRTLIPALTTEVATLQASVAELKATASTGGVDVAALAALIAPLLKDAVGPAVAEEFKNRLES